MALSPDGSTVAAVGDFASIEFWSATTLGPVGRFSDPVGKYTFSALAFSPDGLTLAAAEKDNHRSDHDTRIRFMAAPTGRGQGAARRPAPQPPANAPGEVLVFQKHTGPVTCVTFARDGRLVLSGGDDKTALLWETADGHVAQTLVGHEAGVSAVALSHDGKTALTGSADKSARLWDLVTGREVRKLVGHEKEITQVAFTPDDQRAVTSSLDGSLRLWNLADGKEIRQFPGHNDAIIGMAVAPNGKSALTGSWDWTAKVWDLTNGKEIRNIGGFGDKVGKVAFAADGRRVLTGCTDKTLRLWDTSNGKELVRVETGGDTGWAVALTPDAHRALTADGEDVTLWDLRTRTPPERLKIGDGQIRGLAISPDGRQAAIASKGGSARIWRLPRPAPPQPRR